MTSTEFVALYDMVQAYSVCALFCFGYLMGVR